MKWKENYEQYFLSYLKIFYKISDLVPSSSNKKARAIALAFYHLKTPQNLEFLGMELRHGCLPYQ